MSLLDWYQLITTGVLEQLVKRGEKNKCTHQTIEKRLLYIPASSLPYHVSGYTTRTHEVIRAFLDAGVDVRVATRPGYPWDRGDRVEDTDTTSTTVDTIDYEHVRTPSKHRPVLMFAMQAAGKIADIADREKVSVIHAPSNHENALPVLLAARQLGIPFHYEMRGLWELTRASRMPKYENSAEFLFGLALEGFVASKADRVYVISEQLKEYAQNRWNIPPERFSLLPNCVDPNRIQPADPEKIVHNTIGYAGSLISYEGLDTLIDAVDILIKQDINVFVNIVGDGEARADLEEQVNRLGLSTNIHFLGRVSPKAAREIISSSAIVCLPRKPFKVCEIVPPIKLVEALAMGKPAILPDLPVFRDEAGGSDACWFFRAGDAHDLSLVIREALKDHNELARRAKKAREYVISNRCWKDFVSDVMPGERGCSEL